MMKYCVSFLIALFLCSCVANKTLTNADNASVPLTAQDTTQGPGQVVASEKPTFGKLITQVAVSTTSFNPSGKGVAVLKYTLSDKAKINVKVYDPDWGLIANLIDGEVQAKGPQSASWNGLDDAGMTVPDEAYFFTVKAESESGISEVYDPVTFSGGVSHDIVDAKVDGVSDTISYKMPEMGRVLIRVGIQGGPLMNTIVDWKPRVAGAITDYWNGMDSDGLIDLATSEKSKLIITYFSLPESSIIAFGNREIDYRSYKKKQPADASIKPDRGKLSENVSHHYRLARTIDYAPDLIVNFSNALGNENGAIVLKDKSIVKVELKDEDKNVFINQQFEIAFFLDETFYAEDEVGYTPFNWVWDLSQVEPGEHILTVNVSGFRDQVGVLSRRVKVVK